MGRTHWGRRIGPLAIALSVAGVAVPLVGAHAATAATASVDAAHRSTFRHQSASTSTFTVKAGSSPVHSVVITNIGLVSSADKLALASCPGRPTGWTSAFAAGSNSCLYTALTTAADIAPGGSSSAFQASSSSPVGAHANLTQWVVAAAAKGASLANAGQSSNGALTTKVYNVEVTDALVNAPLTIGAACPASTPTNHSARALSTETLVVCGRNWGSDTFKPNGTDSKLLGTFAVKDTLQTSDPAVPANAGTASSPVVLANYTGALIGPTPGDANLIALMVQSTAPASLSTSALTVMTDYSVLCAATWTVDAASGSDSNSGDCNAPFKTFSKAAALAASDDSIQINVGTYDAANGETFPITVAGGVSVFADLKALLAGKFGQMKVVGDVDLGSGSSITGLVVNGQTSLAQNAALRSSLLFDIPSQAAPLPICADVTGTGVTLTSTIILGCGYGVQVEPGAAATIRGSYFVKNIYGIHLTNQVTTNGIADLGTVASPGGNTLCGGINADLWDQAAAAIAIPPTKFTIQAVGNRWDAVPPAVNQVPLRGVDIALVKAVSNVNAAQATLASSDVVSKKLCGA